MSLKKSDGLNVNNSMTNMLYVVLFLLVAVFSLTMGVKNAITGSAVAGNGPEIEMENYLLWGNRSISQENVIEPTSQDETHMTWLLRAGGNFSDILFVSAPLGIGGVIGVVQVNTGRPQFFGEVEGIPFFNQLKEFKIIALNKVNPVIAKKLAPPGYAVVNGFVVPTALEYLLNSSMLPFFPGDLFIQGEVFDQEGYVQGLPTSLMLKFDMALKPCDDITFYFLACNHVCEISKIKRIRIQCPSVIRGGSSGAGGLPCMWTARKVNETPCYNGQKQVTYAYMKNKIYCPDYPDETVLENCSGPVDMTWPPGEPTVKGAPAVPRTQAAQPLQQSGQPPGQGPQQADLQETYPQTVLANEEFEESYLQLQQNCMNIPTFFGNVKACWD